MSAPSDAAGRPVSRGRLWLILSLVVNLCLLGFIGGLLWHGHKPPPQQREDLGPQFQKLAGELNLNTSQRAAFENFLSVGRQQGRALREQNETLVNSAWDEMAKPQPDETKIAGLLDKASENRQAFQSEMGKALRGFLATLSPEQRAKVIDFARHRQGGTAQRLRRILMQ